MDANLNEHDASPRAVHLRKTMAEHDRYSEGLALLVAERQRQVAAEGWTPEHDDEHTWGELYKAAMCYVDAKPEDEAKFTKGSWRNGSWPWDQDSFKPKDRLSNLVRAGALLLAERERLGRKTVFDGHPWPIPHVLNFTIDGLALAVGRATHSDQGSGSAGLDASS